MSILSGKEFTDKKIADRIIGKMFRGYFNESIRVAKKFAEGSSNEIYYSSNGTKIKPIQFEQHPPGVQSALIEMAYVLGENKLMNFVNMRRDIMSQHYNRASLELINSKWYRTPNLAKRVLELSRKIKVK
jgi:hypothetical protein